MRKLVLLILPPLLFGTALGVALREQSALVAHACDCEPNGLWVIQGVQVDGPAVAWPVDGHVYPDNVSLWANGFSVNGGYGPQ